MRLRGFAAAVAFGLLSWTTGACSSSDEGCKTDNDCKGDRVCESGACVSPQSGGSGGGGFGGSGATGGSSTGGGGSGGCPSECQTRAGTCCAGPNVCDSVPPCLGNPCCSR